MLNEAQKSQLLDLGYVKADQLIPPALVKAARREINAAMGKGMDPGLMGQYGAQTFFPDLRTRPAIVNLVLETPAKALAESAIGVGKILPALGAQIALRFPTMDDAPKRHGPHIDGMYSPTNGVPEGSILNFTALLGVMLSDVPEPDGGNFTVWPGSYRQYEKYFQEKGAQSLLQRMPGVPLPEPVQITGKAGDVVLAHYLLGHSVAPNMSGDVRYMIFFRLKHVDLETRKWESMTDAWSLWEGMDGVRGGR
jgi:hypothetical protein